MGTMFQMKSVLRKPKLATLSVIVQWWRIWKTLPVWSWLVAAEHFRRGEFYASSQHYKKGLARFHNHKVAPYARFDYAYCLYRLNDFLTARQELYLTIKKNAQIKDAYLLLAKIEGALGNSIGQANVLKACLRHFPQETQVVCAYLECLLALELTDAVTREIRDCLFQLRNQKLSSEADSLLVDAVLARYEVTYGEYRLGEQLLARVLATGTAPIEAIVLRGEILLEEGRIFNAREQFRRALEISPRDARAAMFLARTYLHGDTPEDKLYSVQLATLACQRSHWMNSECLQILVQAYQATGEQASAQLIRERANRLQLKKLINVDEIKSLRQTIQELSQVSHATAESEPM